MLISSLENALRELTKAIEVYVLGKKKVSLHDVTLHRTYRGFQQYFLVCSTDAQNVAPIGNQLLHPWNIVIWVIPCSQVWGRHNRLTVSTK